MRIQPLGILMFIFLSSCIVKDKKQAARSIHNNIMGVWSVTHAEVIEVPEKFLNNPALKASEEIAKKNEYSFFDSNRFERYVPGSNVDKSLDLHGTFKIDIAKKQLVWYWEHPFSNIEDTVYFDYVTVNPYKIVMIEGNGVYNVLTILNRKGE